MPSRLWYVAAGVIALAGIVAAMLYAMPRVGAMEAGLTRVVMPGSAVLVFDRPGRYTIFHERRSVVDGRYYASDSVGGLRLLLTVEAGGLPIALTEPGMSTSYTVGDREGRSMFAFDVAEPGRYRLTGALEKSATEPKVVLAVGQGLVGGIFRLVFGTIGIAFGGLGIAGLIVAVVAVRGRKSSPSRVSIGRSTGELDATGETGRGDAGAARGRKARPSEPESRADFTNFVSQEVQRWTAIAKAAGVKME